MALPVIALSKIAVDTGIAGGHNDAAIFLFSEVIPCGLCSLICALEMDGMNKIPVLVTKLNKESLLTPPRTERDIYRAEERIRYC